MNAKSKLEERKLTSITHLPFADIALAVHEMKFHAAFPQRLIIYPGSPGYVLRQEGPQIHCIEHNLSETELCLLVEKRFMKTRKLLLIRWNHPLHGAHDVAVDTNLGDSEISQLELFCKKFSVPLSRARLNK